MTDAPQVSVIVACTRPQLLPAIAASLAASPAVSCQLVVAGDVHSLADRDWPVPTLLIPVAEQHPNSRRRAALAEAEGEVLAFLDDDALPQPGWLDEVATLHGVDDAVWTGPETPTRPSAGAQLAWAVSSSLLAEGSGAHIVRRDRQVRWYEVPFCNLVTSRRLLERVGLPDDEIAWDTDDFDWCQAAAAQGATFHSRRAMAIAHDRYPDSVASWLARKARERRRTGEKLVRYPAIYTRVPGVVAGAAAPFVVAIAALAAGRRRRGAVVLGAATYGAAVARETVRSGYRGRRAASFATLLAGLHVVSIAAMGVGVFDGARARLMGRPDARADGALARSPS